VVSLPCRPVRQQATDQCTLCVPLLRVSVEPPDFWSSGSELACTLTRMALSAVSVCKQTFKQEPTVLTCRLCGLSRVGRESGAAAGLPEYLRTITRRRKMSSFGLQSIFIVYSTRVCVPGSTGCLGLVFRPWAGSHPFCVGRPITHAALGAAGGITVTAQEIPV